MLSCNCCTSVVLHELTSPDPPESVERHISVWKIETEEKNKKSPRFVGYFPQFSQFSEILGKSGQKSSESVRTKIHTAENKGFIFWISSEFVCIRPILENREKLFFQFLFLSHFLEIHFLDFYRIGRFVVHRVPSIHEHDKDVGFL